MATAGLRVRVCLYYSKVAVNRRVSRRIQSLYQTLKMGRSEPTMIVVGNTAQCVTHFLNLKIKYIWHELFFYVSFTLTVAFDKKIYSGMKEY